jgi:formylglycine-generating enzyme required for sulfatase activity
LVRGEFLFAATTFMRAIENKLVEGFNSNPVDLFDAGHAYKVLEAFGRTYGRLPADPTLNTTEHRAFLDEAVNALADNGRINCVRLTLFWEMMKGRTWTPTNLRHLGGVEGVEAAFLEDRFASDNAPPAYRFHQQAAQAVLHRLLPESGANIRGDARSYSELLKTSGYARAQDFEELLHILDGETRLITPCDRAVRSSDPRTENGSSADEKYYQLTHEFLIPPLRQWLTRKKRETRRGRAELDLETLTADWNARPQRRPLPTMTEWLRLRLLTKPNKWTAAQKGMMASADRRHLSRVGASIALTLLLAWIGLEIWRREHIQGLVSGLAIAETTSVSKVISDCDAAGEKSPKIYELALEKMSSHELPILSKEGRLNVQLFLVKRDPVYIKPLIDHLLAASPDEHPVILARLADAVPNLANELWPALRGNALRPDRQLRAACALAALDSGNPLWQEEAQNVALALIRCEQREHVPKWIGGLVPVRQHLIPHLIPLLTDRFRREHFVASEQWIVASALAQFLRSDTERLADLLPHSTTESFPVLLDGLKHDRDQALSVLDRLSRIREEGKSDKERAFQERGKAIAAIARLRLDAYDDFWSLLDAEEDPDFRTAVVDLCAPLGVNPYVLLARLDAERVKPLAKYTIILALTEYLKLSAGSNELRDAIRKRCMALYEQDPDSGVHFATEYVLRLLQPTNGPQATDNQQTQLSVASANWQVTPQGISMVVIRGPQDFVMGSPVSETERENEYEAQRKVHLDHSFAIGVYEVTVEQFRKFGLDTPPAAAVSTSDRDPMSNVNWYDAAKFCRLLSEAEDVEETEMVYPKVEDIKPGMRLSVDWRSKTGYRLPTDEEWECACRAGTTTARFFGRLPSRLVAYGRYNANSEDKLWPVGNLSPNPWGLFDTYGNVLEWCHNQRDLSPPEVKASDDSPAVKFVARSGSYRSVARENRSAKLYSHAGNGRLSFYGLRVARTIRD